MDLFAEMAMMADGMSPEQRKRFKELAEGLIVLLGVMIDMAEKSA